MKLKNLLVSSFILIGFTSMNSSAHAQSISTAESVEKYPDNQLIKKLQSSVNPSALFHQPQKNTVISQKSAAINSRFNALSTHSHDGVMFIPADSIRLFWGEDNHDPDLAMVLLDGLLYFPNNSPSIPLPDETLSIKTDSIRNYGWDQGSSLFKLQGRTVLSFDGNGNVTSEVSMGTSNGIDWENTGRTLYTHDSQGNKLSAINQSWTNAVWVNAQKHTYTYDSQNNMTEIIRYNWGNISSSWEESSRKIMTYEGADKMTNLIHQSWNSTDNAWRNSYRYSMLYTGNNTIQILRDTWNNTAMQWKPFMKLAYAYNGNNQLTTIQEAYWNDGNQEWDNSEKYLYTYDELGNNTSMIEQYWQAGSWNYSSKEEYAYSSLNLTSVTLFDWDAAQFEQAARILYSYNDFQQCTEAKVEGWDGNVWAVAANSVLLRLYYEEFEDNTTGVGPIIDRNEFEIYPNPASGVLKVKLEGKEIQQIRIVDITGRTVFESRKGFSASEANIPVNQLQNGVYILQVTSENQIGTKSFVVRH